jgi:hypothetical protein
VPHPLHQPNSSLQPICACHQVVDRTFVAVLPLALVVSAVPGTWGRSACWSASKSDRVFTDQGSYVKAVRSIIPHAHSSEHRRLFNAPLLALDSAPRLDVQQCKDLLHYCILQAGGTGIFTELPAAKDLSPEQLYALMQLCLQKQLPDSDDDSCGPCSGYCSDCGQKRESVPRS